MGPHPPPATGQPTAVSVRIATDRGGYLSGLALFRLGDVDPWVRWFAQVVADAGDATVNLVRDIAALRRRWEERLVDVRSDAAARRLLDLLPERPVLSALTAAEALAMSERSGRSALGTLEGHGIVEPFPVAAGRPGRPRHW